MDSGFSVAIVAVLIVVAFIFGCLSRDGDFGRCYVAGSTFDQCLNTVGSGAPVQKEGE